MSLELHTTGGEVVALPVDRWLGDATAEEETVLARAIAPVLDVGCGPGRHVLALARRGVASLGIDVSPAALTLARHRGALVLQRSVFGRIPAAGRWGSALLLDGNVGIGGDPVALLRRVVGLVRSGGRVLVELEPPGCPAERGAARLAVGGRTGPWFPWARVGAGEAQFVAAAAGCRLAERWEEAGRWFTQLDVA